VREHPSHKATEYQGSPVALQGYRENREAAQERFERCHLAVSIFSGALTHAQASSSRSLRAIVHHAPLGCRVRSRLRQSPAAYSRLLRFPDNGQDICRELSASVEPWVICISKCGASVATRTRPLRSMWSAGRRLHRSTSLSGTCGARIVRMCGAMPAKGAMPST
jgi:hypothetical protein